MPIREHERGWIRRIVHLVLFILLFFLMLSVAIYNLKQFRASELEVNKMPSSSYHIVSQANKTELQKFALWFHQDWKLVFPTFRDGAKLYFKDLSPDRNRVLHRELLAFIKANAGRSQDEVKKSWLKLGAQGWPPELQIISTLTEFAGLIPESRSNSQ